MSCHSGSFSANPNSKNKLICCQQTTKTSPALIEQRSVQLEYTECTRLGTPYLGHANVLHGMEPNVDVVNVAVLQTAGLWVRVAHCKGVRQGEAVRGKKERGGGQHLLFLPLFRFTIFVWKKIMSVEEPLKVPAHIRTRMTQVCEYASPEPCASVKPRHPIAYLIPHICDNRVCIYTSIAHPQTQARLV